MPVLRPSGSDFTSFVKAAAQYVPPGRSAKVSKSGGVSVALPGLGAVVRTSQVGALASPTTSAVIINGVTPPPVPAPLSGPLPLPITSVYVASYIVKYSALGAVQWTIPFLNSDRHIWITKIVTDATGLYVTGFYEGAAVPIVLYNGDGSVSGKTFPARASTPVTPFMIKYSPSGTLLWAIAHIIGSQSNIPGSGGVVLDSTDVYFSGTLGAYVGTYTLLNGDGTLSSKTTSDTNQNSGYVIKYDKLGFVQWIASVRGNSVKTVKELSIDSTGVYAAGYVASFTASVELFNADGSSSGRSIVTANIRSPFIIKYNLSGTIQWASSLMQVTNTNNVANGTAVDSTGVYVIGSYMSASVTALYNGDGSVSSITLPITPSSGAASDVYIVKHDVTTGAVLWAINIKGESSSYGFKIATDSVGGVYAVGTYYKNNAPAVTLFNGNGSASSKTLPAGSMDNTFLVKYDTSGNVQWATTINDPGNTYSYSRCNLTVDSTGVYIATSYLAAASAISLYNGDGTLSSKTIPSSANNNGVTIKYSPSGVVQWVSVIPGGTNKMSTGVATDSSGIYTAGYYVSAAATITVPNIVI
jgi:hypothetical protein